MSTPIVSFIISAYNGEEFLPECIAGIDAQTFHGYEVIVVDDGSTDGTSEILYRWSRENDRVRVLSRKNDGLTSALNLAISHARGKYLARHDADDISSPYRIERQVSFLDSHPDAALVGSHVVEFNNSVSLISKYIPPDDHNFIVDLLHKGENPIVHGSVLIRKKAFDKLQEGYRFLYSQDYDLYLRILSIGEIRIVPSVMYALRNHTSRTAIQSRKIKRHIKNLIMQVNGIIPFDFINKKIISSHSADKRQWEAMQSRIIQGISADTKDKVDAQYMMSLIGDNLERNHNADALIYSVRSIATCPGWWKTWLSLPYAFIGTMLPGSIRGKWRGKSFISNYRKPCHALSLDEIFQT